MVVRGHIKPYESIFIAIYQKSSRFEQLTGVQTNEKKSIPSLWEHTYVRLYLKYSTWYGKFLFILFSIPLHQEQKRDVVEKGN